jgi:hypothetical protein
MEIWGCGDLAMREFWDEIKKRGCLDDESASLLDLKVRIILLILQSFSSRVYMFSSIRMPFPRQGAVRGHRQWAHFHLPEDLETMDHLEDWVDLVQATVVRQ